MPRSSRRRIALLFVPLALAQRLLHMDGRVTELAVGVDDVDNAATVAAAIREKLGPEFEVHTWDSIAVFVNDIRTRQNFVVSVIAAIFLILMLLGMANTMLMSVLERTREIGTMMAVGVRRQTIVTMFLFEALVMGAMGGTVGAAVGTLIVFLLNRHGIVFHLPGQTAPFVIHPTITVAYLVFVVLLASAGGMLFSLYPAWRAGRLRPVEALAGQ